MGNIDIARLVRSANALRLLSTVAIGLLILLVAGVVGVADGPAQTISVCINPAGNAHDWTLNPTTTATCPAGDARVTWNQQGLTGPPGPEGPGVTLVPLAVGDSHCSNGGLAVSELDRAIQYVCNGINGTPGPPGPSVSMSAVGVGDSHCPAGGIELSASGQTTEYLCNGAQGAAGPEGPQGATGPQGPTTYRGDWNASTTYQPGDVVHYGPLSGNEFLYTAIATNKGDFPTMTNQGRTWVQTTSTLAWKKELVNTTPLTGPPGAVVMSASLPQGAYVMTSTIQLSNVNPSGTVNIDCSDQTTTGQPASHVYTSLGVGSSSAVLQDTLDFSSGAADVAIVCSADKPGATAIAKMIATSVAMVQDP